MSELLRVCCGRGKYRYVVVGLNGDAASTGFASRISALTEQMVKDGSRVLVVRFVPLTAWVRRWKGTWERGAGIDLLEVPALPISRFTVLRKFSLALCTIILRAIVSHIRPEVLQCECHEAAALGGRLPFRGKKYVDVHGAAPEEARYARLATGRRDMSIVRWLNQVEKDFTTHFDKVIVVSPKMIDHLEDKNGHHVRHKAEVLPIFADRAFFGPVNKALWKGRLGLHGRVVFLYSGGMQGYQCIDETVLWFKELRARIPSAFLLILTPSIKIAETKINALAKDFISDVRIMSVGPADLPDYISAADFGFVLREDEVLNRVSSPTKAAEYLTRQVALICTSAAGSAANHVASFRSGLIVPKRPTRGEVDLAIDQIWHILGTDFPIEDVRNQLSPAAYSSAINGLYGRV